MCAVGAVAVCTRDYSEYLLQQVELMRCEVVEVARARNVGLQTPRQIVRCAVVEVARRHREAYLHVRHRAYLARLDNLLHLLEVGQVAAVVSHETGHACNLADAVDACAVLVARCQRLFYIHGLASLHRHDSECSVARRRSGDIYSRHLRVVNELLRVGIPALYAVTLGVRLRFSLVAAHHSHNLRAGHLVESRS